MTRCQKCWMKVCFVYSFAGLGSSVCLTSAHLQISLLGREWSTWEMKDAALSNSSWASRSYKWMYLHLPFDLLAQTYLAPLASLQTDSLSDNFMPKRKCFFLVTSIYVYVSSEPDLEGGCNFGVVLLFPRVIQISLFKFYSDPLVQNKIATNDMFAQTNYTIHIFPNLQRPTHESIVLDTT